MILLIPHSDFKMTFLLLTLKEIKRYTHCFSNNTIIIMTYIFIFNMYLSKHNEIILLCSNMYYTFCTPQKICYIH